MSGNLTEKDEQCILFCVKGYGDKKLEYTNGAILVVAKNLSNIVAATNVLVFLVEAVFGKFRVVAALYFVKNLDDWHLSQVLTKTLIAIAKFTNLLEYLPVELTMAQKTKDVARNWYGMKKLSQGVFLTPAVQMKQC